MKEAYEFLGAIERGIVVKCFVSLARVDGGLRVSVMIPAMSRTQALGLDRDISMIDLESVRSITAIADSIIYECNAALRNMRVKAI